MSQVISRASRPTAPASTRPWWTPGVVAGSYLAATVLASIIANPAHPRALAPVPLLLAVLAGLLGAVTIGPLAQRLRLPLGQRFAVVALLAYLLSTITNEVEALLFIKGSSALVPVTGAILALGLAVPVTLLWPPADTETTIGAALRRTLTSRPWWSWAWRITLATLLWVPVYFVFAAADAPFVHLYYHRTGTTFTIPSTGIIALAELARGLLHALVLGALAALLGRNRRSSWFWLALAFATLNAWLPLVQRSDWPYFLRADNIVEITGDAVVYAGLVALLLTRRRRPGREPITGAGS
jgi:hypothetical protein